MNLFIDERSYSKLVCMTFLVLINEPLRFACQRAKSSAKKGIPVKLGNERTGSAGPVAGGDLHIEAGRSASVVLVTAHRSCRRISRPYPLPSALPLADIERGTIQSPQTHWRASFRNDFLPSSDSERESVMLMAWFAHSIDFEIEFPFWQTFLIIEFSSQTDGWTRPCKQSIIEWNRRINQ